MSDVQKPVEEPVVAPTTETPVVSEPVPEAKPAEETPAVPETTTETPAVAETAPAATEEAAAPVKEEAKPIEEGTLGYKGPGLIKYVFSSFSLHEFTPGCFEFLVLPREGFVYPCTLHVPTSVLGNSFFEAYLQRGAYCRTSFASVHLGLKLTAFLQELNFPKEALLARI